MKPGINIFLLALAVVLLLSFAATANACTCAQVSPCEAYANASVVFVGVVTNTAVESGKSHWPSNAMSTTLTGGSAVARFKVEESFLGVDGAEIEIAGESTTCDYPFKLGERYVVYAYQRSDGKSFHTNICSGTALLSEARDDLSYLRNAVNQRSGGTLFGEITRESNSQVKNESASGAIAKAEVILDNGKQRFQAMSDRSGKFELRGLPAGRYKVHTNPSTNYSRADVVAEEPRNEWELEVPGHGCVHIWFVARPGGEISGTVTDVSGIVPEDVEPELFPVDDNTDFRGVRLGEFGSFRFTFLPAGRYYLGFNIKSGPSVGEPYPEFYYPGVEERAKATIITLGEGQKVSGLYLPRPLRLAERMIQGIAVWPDGRPFVENCSIQLTNPRTGHREGNCVSTDAQGRFTIKAIETQIYELSATITVGKSIGLVSSKPVVVKVGKENRPLKLIVEPR